jgi:oligoribonuclease
MSCLVVTAALLTRLQSGLTKACIESPNDIATVKDEVLAYIKKWIPNQRTAVLAGNSVHADRAFLLNEMPDVLNWLHYRYDLRSP